MKMVLAAPVVDGHLLTFNLMRSLDQTVADKTNFEFVIVDNASERPYKDAIVSKTPKIATQVVEYEKNTGYYYPLIDLYERYPDADLIGLIHNDMVIYEPGFDERMKKAFADDPQLGLVGLCGSNEIDQNGGRGAGTMLWFRGGEVKIGDRVIKGQDQSAGRRIFDLEPAVCLDSLFMMFRRDAIPALMNQRDPWQDITLAHFYDRIWPIRTIEAGYRVGVLGVDCDHLGGMTTTANERYRDDCIKWLEDRNIPYDNPETEMYLVAERRFLSEYREEKRFLPCIIGGDYAINHLAR